jgi:hypothetical protein
MARGADSVHADGAVGAIPTLPIAAEWGENELEQCRHRRTITNGKTCDAERYLEQIHPRLAMATIFDLKSSKKNFELIKILMPTVQYTSYRLPSEFQISEDFFLEIRNMPEDQFVRLLEIQTDKLKQDFWEDHAATLKVSLCFLAASALLAFIPAVSVIAAIAFVAGFFGLFSLAEVDPKIRPLNG